jgi:hypothetical protein
LVGGLYSVLWAKSREQNTVDESCLRAEVEKDCSKLKETKEDFVSIA